MTLLRHLAPLIMIVGFIGAGMSLYMLLNWRNWPYERKAWQFLLAMFGNCVALILSLVLLLGH